MIQNSSCGSLDQNYVFKSIRSRLYEQLGESSKYPRSQLDELYAVVVRKCSPAKMYVAKMKMQSFALGYPLSAETVSEVFSHSAKCKLFSVCDLQFFGR